MRKFLLLAALGTVGVGMTANGEQLTPFQKAGEKVEPFIHILRTAGDDLISFAKDAKGVEFITFHKDVSGAFRAARIAANVSEQATADALGLDLNSYVDFEENGGEIDVTGANLKAVAKTFKMPVEDLAAQLLATPKPVAPGMSGEGNTTTGSQADPPGASGDPASVGKSTGFRSTQKTAIALEKSALGSTQIRSIRVEGMGEGTYTHADLLDAAIPIEKRKQEASRRFAKEFLGINDRDYAQIKKSGLITADMFGPNPAIDPVLASTIINLYVGEDQYLKQVQTKVLQGKKQNINIMDIPFRLGTRLDPNTWPGSSVGANPINRSIQADAKGIDWTYILPDDTIMTYRGVLPQIEADITGGFVKVFSTDTWDLGLNGTTETFTGPFTTLARGWLALMRSGNEGTRLAIDAAVPAGQQISISGGGYTTVSATLDAMLAAAVNPSNGNARFFTDTTPFLMSSYNWQLLKTQLKAANLYLAIERDGFKPNYEGHPILVSNKLGTTDIVLTEMQNLGVGIVAGMPGAGGDGISIEKFRVIKASRFVATLYVDYFVPNSKAAVITNA